MIEFLIINQILIFLITAIALWLAFLVYRNNPQEKISKLFILMTAAMLLWVNFAFLARAVGESQINQSLFYIKIAWFVTPLLFTFLALLTIHIVEKKEKYKFLNKIVLLIGIISASITGFTNLIIEGTKFENGGLIVLYGKGMLPFLIAVLFLMGATLYPLLKKYFEKGKREKKKLEFFLIGILIFYIANFIFNIALPIKFKVSQYYYIGDYSTIFLLGFTAYAIVKHKLFDVKIILTTTLVGLIAVLLALDALFFTTNFSVQVLKAASLSLFLFFGYYLIKSVKEEVKRREEAEILSRAKSEFISMASHQLRTPLTVIKGYVAMILDGSYGKIKPETKKVLGNISISTERLVKIIEDLLNISRIELGKMDLERNPTDIKEMIDNICQEIKIKAKEKNLELVWKKPKSQMPKLNIDELKIRQVVYNIVDNAIKYTEKGKVKIDLSRKNSDLVINISDTGRGFSKKDNTKLFELFSRGEAGTDTFVEGTGMGLYVAKKFVTLHKGKIWAESKGKNKGSAFHIELPIK